MYIDEYDDDFIDYDDLDDGEEYSYPYLEKQEKKEKQKFEKEMRDLMISDIFCEIYTDILVAHRFDIRDIEHLSEEKLYKLIADNELIDEVITHKRYGETW